MFVQEKQRVRANKNNHYETLKIECSHGNDNHQNHRRSHHRHSYDMRAYVGASMCARFPVVRANTSLVLGVRIVSSRSIACATCMLCVFRSKGDHDRGIR